MLATVMLTQMATAKVFGGSTLVIENRSPEETSGNPTLKPDTPTKPNSPKPPNPKSECNRHMEPWIQE